jgi:hypothetical protein
VGSQSDIVASARARVFIFFLEVTRCTPSSNNRSRMEDRCIHCAIPTSHSDAKVESA